MGRENKKKVAEISIAVTPSLSAERRLEADSFVNVIAFRGSTPPCSTPRGTWTEGPNYRSPFNKLQSYSSYDNTAVCVRQSGDLWVFTA